PRCEVLPILSRTDQDGKCESTRLPARSPNLNSYAERWVKSVKEECLSRLILFGKSSLRRALQQYMEHYHGERNHQGKDNRILFLSRPEGKKEHGTSAVSRTTRGNRHKSRRDRWRWARDRQPTLPRYMANVVDGSLTPYGR